MSRMRTLALVAAAAVGLTVAQPKPAEASGWGGVAAGIAIAGITAALLHHHHRAYAAPSYYYRPYYHAPRVYYHHRGHSRYWHPRHR
jgi:hypothetical protein